MDKRQWSRTQGRFAHDNDRKSNKNNESRVLDDEDVKKNTRRGSTKSKKSDKDVKRNSPRSLENSPKVQSGSGKNNAYEKGSLVYQEVANDNDNSFIENEKPSPITIETSGLHSLSETENGKSIIFYKTDFMDTDKADDAYNSLSEDIKWYDKNIVIRGKEYPQPRLVAWFGPLPYKYSGVTLEAKEFPPLILDIKKNLENVLRRENIDVELNSVLLNLYRNGKDSVAWHSDDEISMGIKPTIVSVSLGETRRFEMRRKPDEPQSTAEAEYVVHLTHGSLIVMDGAMQLDWQHRVPKEYHDKRKRINLTFRTVYPIAKVPRSRLTDHKSFIPPPYPKLVSTPFELHGEEFPALGNSSSCTAPEQYKNASEGENESHINRWENPITKSSLSSTFSQPAGSEESSNQKQNVNFSSEKPPIAHVNASAGVTYDSWADIPDETFIDDQEYKKNSSKTQDIDSSSEKPPTTHVNASAGVTYETWADVPDEETFVNDQEYETNSSKTQDINSSSEKPATSENASADAGIWDDIHNIKPFIPGEACVSQKRKISSPSTYDHEKQEINERNHAVNSKASTKPSIKDNLYSNYDYVFTHWEENFFSRYERDELNVLMKIAEYAEDLPEDVVIIVSERIGLLINNATRRCHGERIFHNQIRNNRFSRNNGRNPNHRYYN